MPTHLRHGVILLLAVLCGAGCVQREMTITSEPEGAQVMINQTWQGKTPFTLRFKHYGVYDIRLTAPGYYPLRVKEPIRGPGYEKFGVDFVSEALIPKRIQDKRQLHYKLEKIEKEDDINDILTRDSQLRDKSYRIAAKREAKDKTLKHLTLPLPTDKKKHAKRKKKKKDKAQDKESATSKPKKNNDKKVDRENAAEATKENNAAPELDSQ